MSSYYLLLRHKYYILYMDDRLIKMFEESRRRHSNETTKEKKPEKTLDQIKRDKAQKLKARYIDLDKKKFGVGNDLDVDWIVENIINSKCEYCDESNWNKLGCDRIDNSKPHTKDNVICSCGRCNVVRGNKFSVEDMKEIGEVIKRIERRNTVYKVAKKKGKAVAKVDRDGNIIKTYPSIMETVADGYNRTCVGKACKSYKEKSGYDRSVYKGYYWTYI